MESIGENRPAHMEPTATPKEILRDYLDRDVAPQHTPNQVMVVGTGGLGIWERTWQGIVLEGAKEEAKEEAEYRLSQEGAAEPGIIRAMCFASDLSASPENRIRMLSGECYALTPAGIRQREMFREQMEQALGRKTPERTTPGEARMRRFQARFPDWLTRFRHLQNIATDAVQLGKHLCFMGFFQGEEELVRDGRETMRAAVRFLDAAVTDESASDAAMESIPQPLARPEDAREYAQQAVGYLREVTRTFQQGPGDTQAFAKEFVAHALIPRLAHRMRGRNMELLHDLGAKEGGIPSEMRAISDDVFRARGGSDSMPIRNARQSLAALDEAALDERIRELAEIQEALLAAAYTEFHRPMPAVRLPTEENNREQVTGGILRMARTMLPRHGGRPGAAGFVRDEIVRRTDRHLERALDSLPRVARNDWQHGDFTPDHANYLNYHLRLGLELMPLTSPRALERDLEFAAQHPQWRDFLAGRVRFRDPRH